MATTWLPAATSVLALVFSLALFDQWRERRQTFQLVWAAGMLFYGVASGCEAIGAASGWNEALYRTWYLTGAIWTAGWLGLGTAFLLGRTRFGYTFALCLLLAGVFTLLTQRKFEYAGSGTAPILYLIGAVILAAAVAIETYFQNERWPRLAAGAVVGATVLSLVLMLTVTLPAPGYVLDPNASGDQFLFNLLISPVAIVVNFVASLPGAIRALFSGRLHSRVPATILIAIGGLLASGGDALNRFGVTNYFQIGKFLSVLFLLAGFLISIETFREIRIPFTAVRLRGRRTERGFAGADGRSVEPAGTASAPPGASAG